MIERFALFHHLPPAPGARPLPKTPADFAKTLDFHKALSALSAYPTLMRALGLVIDVTLPRNFVAPSPGSLTTSYRTLSVSKVTPGWSWHVKTSLSRPSTSYVKDAQQFDAAPATGPAAAAKGNFEPSDIVEGYLALAPHLFGLIDVDLDGALLKAMGLADNIAAVSDISLVEPILPSLRSGGVSLIANGRAQEVLRSIRDNTAFMNAEASGVFPRALTARDVTRGYRLDIWSTLDGAWRSLHRRNSTYAFGSDGGLVVHVEDEEGFTQLGVAQPTPDPTRKEDKIAKAAGIPQPGTDLYVHERIARWNGWSLARRGRRRPSTGLANPAVAANPDPTADEPITPFKMKASFSAFRVRSWPIALRRPLPAASARRRSRRQQPCAPGGGSEPLRRTARRSAALLPFRAAQPTRVPAAHSTRAQAARCCAWSFAATTRDLSSTRRAPRRSTSGTSPRRRWTCSLSSGIGRFDDAQGHVRGDKATYELIIARDSGAFPAVGHTPIEPAAQAATPYFPDPIARGVAFANLPEHAR